MSDKSKILKKKREMTSILLLFSLPSFLLCFNFVCYLSCRFKYIIQRTIYIVSDMIWFSTEYIKEDYNLEP